MTQPLRQNNLFCLEAVKPTDGSKQRYIGEKAEAGLGRWKR